MVCGRVHFPNNSGTFLRKFTRQSTLILQSPHDDRRRITPFLHPLPEQFLEIIPKFRRIIPDMCRELRPEQDPLLIPIRLIIEMMGLMGISECIKAGSPYLFGAGSHLLTTECVALPELMFIFAYPIDKNRSTVQKETSVSIFTFHRPAKCANSERSNHLIGRFYLIGGFHITLYHTGQLIKIRILRTP